MTLADGHRPTPQPAESATPLGRPQLAPPDWGSFAFLHLQDDGVAPVAWDPCRPIHYVVNGRTAPRGGDVLLVEAIAAVGKASGLQLVAEGGTDEVPSSARVSYQPDRYGDRWAPVLIAWTDPSEMAELAGDIAGLAGSLPVAADARGQRAYVSGLVVLDGPQLGEAIAAGRRDGVRGVIVHELGHLLGLAHVDDPQQLMHARGGTLGLRYGDLRGLVQLGSGACFDQL